MIDERIMDVLVERLVNRIEQGNTYTLEQIGKVIKQIGSLSPTNAYQLGQMIKYGGNYDKIARKLAEITNLNVRDIYKIFDEVAKNDYQFAEKFYKYRNAQYIPYDENMALRNQVRALAEMTAKEYVNLSNTLAFTRRINGKIVQTPLSEAYNEILDKAILSVAQGKETFQQQMYQTIKELGENGLKTVDFGEGRTMRLDSAVRMHMKDALRTLHNETQKVFGEEFGADGVEISVHQNPAPDHAKVQGKQFSNKEFEKFQTDRKAVSYDGVVFEPEFNGHDRRSISQYNCYHYTFAIVLGVSSPEYTNEQLEEIIETNNEGFELDGKHYTNYEGTQLQRNIEVAIRKQKDVQIMARASDNDELVAKSQDKINKLTQKYHELSRVSGLPEKKDRLRVSGYKRASLNKKQTPGKASIITASHITTPENRSDILKQGFTLEKSGSQVGNTFGKGVYLTTGQKEIDRYKFLIKNGEELKVDIDTTGFMKVKYDNYTSADNRFDPIIEKFKEDEAKQYKQLLEQFKEENELSDKLYKEGKPSEEWKKYRHIDPRQDAVVKILEEKYPGLIIESTTPEFDVILGGNQIVVYDTERIKKVKKG